MAPQSVKRDLFLKIELVRGSRPKAIDSPTGEGIFSFFLKLRSLQKFVSTDNFAGISNFPIRELSCQKLRIIGPVAQVVRAHA